MNVVIDKLLVNYELAGKGRLILLLHGWGDNLQGLKGLSAFLSEKYRVLAVDLPGFGATQPPRDVWDLDNYVEFINKLLIKLDLQQPEIIIGHSNGGALAIHGVGAGKFSPKKMVLIASSGVRNGQPIKRGILKFIAKVGNVATLWMPERYRQDLRKNLYGAAGSDMLVAPHLEETFKKTVRQDVQPDAAKIQIPTLLIYGSDDKAVPVADGRKFNELIQGSKIEIIQGAGHFVHLDESQKVQLLIDEFLT